MNQVICIDDDEDTSDRKNQKHDLETQIEQIISIPNEEQKNINNNRRDKIKIKHINLHSL